MTAWLATASLIDAFQEDDPVLQQQVAEGHLPLAVVVAVALELGSDRVARADGRRAWNGPSLVERLRDRSAGVDRRRTGHRTAHRADRRPGPGKAEGADAERAPRIGPCSGSVRTIRPPVDSARVLGLLGWPSWRPRRASRRRRSGSSAATSSTSTDSRMRSSALRSRIWVARLSARPSFSTRARTRRTLSSDPGGHRLDLQLQVLVLDLDRPRPRRSWPGRRTP